MWPGGVTNVTVGARDIEYTGRVGEEWLSGVRAALAFLLLLPLLEVILAAVEFILSVFLSWSG
jgi:hypothetical protein